MSYFLVTLQHKQWALRRKHGIKVVSNFELHCEKKKIWIMDATQIFLNRKKKREREETRQTPVCLLKKKNFFGRLQNGLTCAWTRCGSMCCWNIGNTVIIISFWDIKYPTLLLSLWTREMRCEWTPPTCFIRTK